MKCVMGYCKNYNLILICNLGFAESLILYVPNGKMFQEWAKKGLLFV